MTVGVYRHYKGGYYRVLGLATDSTNRNAGRQVVLYVSLTTGQMRVRDRLEFCEFVRDNTPRFQYVGDSIP